MDSTIVIALISLVGTIATPIITVIGNKNTTQSTIKKEIGSLQTAIKSTLCESLIRRAKEYKKAKTISEEDYQRFCDDYKTYKALPNANGYVDDLKTSVEKIYMNSISA